MVGPRAPRIPDEIPGLAVERVQIGQRIVLAVAGEIDMATAPSLTSAVEQALGDGARELWIDLTQVTFLDSTGIHVLVQAHSCIAGGACSLAVICPVGPVRRTLAITGLDEALPVYATREEAHRHG